MHETERASLATGLSTDFASSGAAVVVMRSDGTFLYVGEGFCELVGRTRAELVGLRADETGIASSAGRTRWILDRASEVGAAFAYRRLYPTAAGDRYRIWGMRCRSGQGYACRQPGENDARGPA